jgi:GT2 family glycosyltransferase
MNYEAIRDPCLWELSQDTPARLRQNREYSLPVPDPRVPVTHLLDLPFAVSDVRSPGAVLRGAAVVICTCERPAELARCLAAVARLVPAPERVVVADNAPETGLAAPIAARFGAGYVAVRPRGVSRTRNAGARACVAQWVAFLDDDMVPRADWLGALAAEFADPRVVSVTGPVLPLAPAATADIDSELRRLPWGPARFQVDRETDGWFERAHFGGIGDGNMAWRRTAFENWGFEESIGRGMPVRGGEEHYAFYGAIERGGRVAYTPAAVVFHPEKAETTESRLRCLRDVAAYAAFVVARHPRHAPKVARYFIEGAVGKNRPWRPASRESIRDQVSWPRLVAALASGALLYWHARKAQREHLPQAAEVRSIART